MLNGVSECQVVTTGLNLDPSATAVFTSIRSEEILPNGPKSLAERAFPVNNVAQYSVFIVGVYWSFTPSLASRDMAAWREFLILVGNDELQRNNV